MKATEKPQRFMELEGLRGIAALVVVIYHFMITFYPNIAFGANSMQHMRFEDNLYGNPLNVFLSGGFAVGIFFVLSGFVLSIGFFQTKKESIVKKLASKRYLRLMLPALASVILSFILLSLNFDANRDASVVITQSGTVGEWNFALNFFDAIRQGTFGIFFESVRYYNPVLWTMTYEFIGSFIIFLFLFLFGMSSHRWIVYGLLLFATFSTWYFAIIMGTILADLYAHNKMSLVMKNQWAGSTLLIGGLFLGGYPFGEPQGTIYAPLLIPGIGESANIVVYVSIGAFLTTAGILSLKKMSAFFGSRYVSSLGKYTYSLYLTHALIILTLTPTLFMWFIANVGYNKAAILSILCSVPIMIITTWLFERYIDTPSIKLANFFADVHLKGREFRPAASIRAQLLLVRTRFAIRKIEEEIS